MLLHGTPITAKFTDNACLGSSTGAHRQSYDVTFNKFDLPMLIMHGDDDQIVPIDASAMRSTGTV
jgi:alpha-beta hydrolase superfamily lysophospholipase